MASPGPQLAGGVPVDKVALQLAVAPVLTPVQLQLKGPEPVTAEAVPALHRLLVGAEENEPPLDAPQAPLTT